MKKFLATILVCIFLCSCGETASSHSAAHVENNTGKVGVNDLRLVTQIDGTSNCCTEEGYYRVEIDSHGLAKIYYIDFASASQVALCNRPECTHEDTSCNAVISRWAAVFTNKNQLYLYYPQIGDASEEGLARIEQMDADGSNRHIAFTFPADTNVNYGIVADDSAFYFMLRQTTAQDNSVQDEYSLMRLSLADWTLTTLKQNRLAVEGPIGAQGRSIMIKSIALPTEKDENIYHTVSLFDVDHNTETEFTSWTGSNEITAAFDGEFYRVDRANNQVVQIGWDKAQQPLCPWTDKKLSAYAYFEGKYQDLIMLLDSDSEDPLMMYRWAIDCDTGDLFSITLSYDWILNGESRHYLYSPLAQYENSLLVICGGEPVDFTDRLPDGTEVPRSSYEIQYGLIPIKDFCSNDASNMKIINNIDRLIY